MRPIINDGPGGQDGVRWYDLTQFSELLLACAGQPVRSLIAQLDGCSGGKAGEIAAAARLERMSCEMVARTWIEIGLGPMLPADTGVLRWIQDAARVPGAGKSYEGRSPP